MSKTPQQAVQEAMTRFASSQMFHDERTARQWVGLTSLGFLQHKLAEMALTPEERDEDNPITAGLVHAKDIGTRQRRQRIGWIDALIERVAASTFCETLPLSGTLSTWLIGRQADRQVALYLLSGLVPTAERMSQDAYLVEYHKHRKDGNVEAARGFKDVYLKEWVDNIDAVFAQQRAMVKADDPTFENKMGAARQEVVSYMNENFLPTRGNKTMRMR